MALNAAKFVTQEFAYTGSHNPFAGLFFSSLASLVFALILSFGLEGRTALPTIFCWHVFWRFLALAALFTTATFLTIRAYRTGLMSVVLVLLGYSYMPISVGLSYCVFRREYGKLEWLATAMMVLATVAFLLVRERCHLNDCKFLVFWYPSRDVNALGIIFVLSSVLVSVVASLLSERLYKQLSPGLLRTCGRSHNHSFYVMKVHLDFSSVLIWGCVWMVSVSPWGFLVNGSGRAHDGWLGSWTLTNSLLVFVTAGQGWLAALVTKRFDTVVRSLMQTLSTVIAVCIFDPMQHNKWNFSRRWLASLTMAGIVLVSALVFQTARINLQTIRRSLNLPLVRTPSRGMGWWDSVKTMLVLPCCGFRPEVSRNAAEAPEAGRAPKSATPRNAHRLKACCLSALKYASIILYILADGFRTVLQSAALSQTMNTPQVFVVVTNVCGLLLANGLTLWYNGCQGLRQAWDLRKICRFLLCGFFFALTSTLQALAFALHISPALSMVVGKFYTPMLAILSWWILGKFFLTLEWFAITILTLANIAYGSIQTMAEADEPREGGSVWASLVPALCVLGSAASSCLNTLLMERLMTGEEKLPSGEGLPFHMQKVRLDAGTVFWSIVFLPAFGLIAHGPSSAQYAFWKERPLTRDCARLGVCEDGVFAALDAASAADASACTCGGGLFVGWSTPAIYTALAVNVFYSWITGVVVVQFTSIYRAIADAFSLALVYFLLQPVSSASTWDDTGLDFVAILIPISAVTFSFSANEMHKVMQLAGGTSEDTPSEEQRAPDGDDIVSSSEATEGSDGSEGSQSSETRTGTCLRSSSEESSDEVGYCPVGSTV